jgi:HEAT repeat protein
MLISCLLLCLLPQAKGPANQGPAAWTEIRFHRVHLRNGNFIDGDLVRQSAREVVLRLKSGEMGIRRDLITRVEFIKMRGIQDKPEEVEAPKAAPLGFETPMTKPATPPPTAAKKTSTPRARAEGAYKASAEVRGKVDPLLEKLERADPEMIDPLVQELAEMEPEAHAYLASQLEVASRSLVPLIGSVLSRTKSPMAAPYLNRLLGHENPQVRKQAAAALATNGESSDASFLIPVLRDKDPEVLGAAIATLSIIGEESAFDAIAPLCLEEDREVRTQALGALSSLASKHDLKERLVRTLSETLASAPANRILDLLGALASTGDVEAAPAIAKMLDSEQVEIRKAAADGLSRIAGPDVADEIVARVGREDNAEVRVALAGAAAKAKAVDAMDELAAWLEDENGGVRKAALDALRALSRTDFGPDRAKWEEWIENNAKKN